MKHLFFNKITILFLLTRCVYASSFFTKYSSADFVFSNNYTGEKLVFPFFEYHGYQFSDYSLFELSYNADSYFKNMPCSIKVGNLTNGGLFSKLKSPVINSTISPFGNVAAQAIAQKASLPSANSTFKPQSLFIQAGYSENKSVLQDIRLNWFNSPQENISVFSGNVKAKTGERSNLSFSSCAGYFDYSEKESSSWFLADQYYKSGIHFCNISQISFKSPIIDSSFYLGFFETPFSSYANFYRFESKVSSQHFIYTFAGSYIPNKILTADDSILKEQLQLKGGIQYRFICGETYPLLCKTGIVTYCKINLLENEHPVKATAGFQLTSPFTSLSVSAGINATATSNSFTNGAPSAQITIQSGSIQIKNSWFINDFSPGFTAGVNISPASDYSAIKTTESYGIDILWKGTPKTSFTNKFSIERKNLILENLKFTTSINVKFVIKNISVTIKLSAE